MIAILMVCMFQSVHAKINSVNLAIIFNVDFAMLLCCIYKYAVGLQQFQLDFCGSTCISESVTDIIKIQTANLMFSTTASSKRVFLGLGDTVPIMTGNRK